MGNSRGAKLVDGIQALPIKYPRGTLLEIVSVKAAANTHDPDAQTGDGLKKLGFVGVAPSEKTPGIIEGKVPEKGVIFFINHNVPEGKHIGSFSIIRVWNGVATEVETGSTQFVVASDEMEINRNGRKIKFVPTGNKIVTISAHGDEISDWELVCKEVADPADRARKIAPAIIDAKEEYRLMMQKLPLPPADVNTSSSDKARSLPGSLGLAEAARDASKITARLVAELREKERLNPPPLKTPRLGRRLDAPLPPLHHPLALPEVPAVIPEPPAPEPSKAEPVMVTSPESELEVTPKRKKVVEVIPEPESEPEMEEVDEAERKPYWPKPASDNEALVECVVKEACNLCSVSTKSISDRRQVGGNVVAARQVVCLLLNDKFKQAEHMILPAVGLGPEDLNILDSLLYAAREKLRGENQFFAQIVSRVQNRAQPLASV